MQKTKVGLLSLLLILVLIMQILILPVSTGNAYAEENQRVEAAGYKISGYVSPDFQYDEDKASILKAGFNVTLSALQLSAVTDSNGYFEISGVPESMTGYTLTITKPGYLKRTLSDVVVTGNVQISTPEQTLNIWAGDIAVNGTQDDAININDIMEIAKIFNSVAGDGKYKEEIDLNYDGVVNLADVMVMARHFNKTSSQYPVWVITEPTVVTAIASNSKTVEVTFNKDVSTINKDEFSIQGLVINDAYIKDGDSKTLVLKTSQQTAGTIYNLVYKSNSHYFVGMGGIAPEDQDAALQKITVENLWAQYVNGDRSKVNVTWEPLSGMQVQATGANGYTILYCTDQNCISSVWVADINASSQVISGLQADVNYKFAIYAENGRTKSLISQYVYASDDPPTELPNMVSARAIDYQTVEVTFDRELANVKKEDFVFNNNLSVVDAKIKEADKKVAVITTSPQTLGIVYLLTYKNESTYYFAGMGQIEAPAISSVTAINNRQIKVVFNKEVTGVDSNDFYLKKGSLPVVGFETIASEINPVYQIDAKTYILTINSTAANWLVSEVYTLGIDGDITDLNSTPIDVNDETKATKMFGGITNVPSLQAVAIQHIEPTLLKVTFNSEVKVTPFDGTEDITVILTNQETGIGLQSVDSSFVDASNPRAIYLRFASDIPGNKVATLRIRGQEVNHITDVTGNIPLPCESADFEMYFGTTEFGSTLLKLSTVTCIDNQTLELSFNQDINFQNITTDINDGDFASINRKDGMSVVAGVDYDLKTAFQVSPNKVRVYFKRLTDRLQEGFVYDFQINHNINGDSLFKTIKGIELDATEGTNAIATFAYNITENEAPYLQAVIPVSPTRIQLTFSEDLSAVPTTNGNQETNITIWKGNTQISDTDLSDAYSAEGDNRKVFYMDLLNGKFEAGTTYCVKMPNTLTITDVYLVDTIKKATQADPNLFSVIFGGIA